MPTIEIDQKTCNQCGICVAECPLCLIELPAGGFPQPTALADTACLACGHCVMVCPSGSLNQREAKLEKSIKIKDSLKISPEQCEQLLRSRRSVRVFKDQPVSREIITRLIEDARYAPTGGNRQGVEWLVIDSRKELDRIEELGTDWIKGVIKNVPGVAAELNMDDLLRRQNLKHSVFLRGAPALIVAHAVKDTRSPSITAVDCANALAYLDLAASSLGLGTCWAGFVFTMANNFPPVKSALALPEGNAAYGCLMLGYNKYKYQGIPYRREPKIAWK